jgi:hypothetical protein
MSAGDYVSATKTVSTQVALAGTVIAASWDDELTAQMMELNERGAEEALVARYMLIELELGVRSPSR